jgi:hypothetical protein
MSLNVFFVFAFAVSKKISLFLFRFANYVFAKKKGRFERYAYTSSTRVKTMYHVVCWTVVLVDFVIVWGIYALNPSWSYAPLQPYSFCWIGNSDVLLGAFFVPASIGEAFEF